MEARELICITKVRSVKEGEERLHESSRCQLAGTNKTPLTLPDKGKSD